MIKAVLKEINASKDTDKIESLQELELTSCGLEYLDDFKIFKRLKILRVSFNKIKAFDMSLSRLEDLDLSNNKIFLFPDLSNLPHIRHVRLNNNLISIFGFD